MSVARLNMFPLNSATFYFIEQVKIVLTVEVDATMLFLGDLCASIAED